MVTGNIASKNLQKIGELISSHGNFIAPNLISYIVSTKPKSGIDISVESFFLIST